MFIYLDLYFLQAVKPCIRKRIKDKCIRKRIKNKCIRKRIKDQITYDSKTKIVVFYSLIFGQFHHTRSFSNVLNTSRQLKGVSYLGSSYSSSYHRVFLEVIPYPLQRPITFMCHNSLLINIIMWAWLGNGWETSISSRHMRLDFCRILSMIITQHYLLHNYSLNNFRWILSILRQHSWSTVHAPLTTKPINISRFPIDNKVIL